jgi:RNA polymerase sigma factor (sigma-70 family)
MTRGSEIPPESLEEILAWLNPDRDVAATMFVQLRHDLAKIFTYRGCADAEGLTDEVIDRVSMKVHALRLTYKGDPRHYFRAVANNLIKEYLKDVKTQVPIDDVDPPEQKPTENEEEIADREECLHWCLKKLTPEKRKLIVDYYAKEKQAKIDHRHQLAQHLGSSVETLRVKVYRIRLSLHECIERCLERKAKRK